MKILVHDYAGHAFPVSLSRELARRGHQVAHCFASALQTPRGDLRRREDDSEGLEFHPVPMSLYYARDKYVFWRRARHERQYAARIARRIFDTRPDVVLSGNAPSDVQNRARRACEAVDSHFVYWVQDFYSIAIDSLLRKKLGPLGALIGQYYCWMDRTDLKRSDHVIGITRDFLPLFGKWGVPRWQCSTIPNWAELEAFPLQPKANDWAARHDLADKFVFMYSGTLGMKHNPGLLLALARQMAAHPEVRIVVNSEGLGADWLRERIAEGVVNNIVVNGYQPFDEMPQVLGTADVFLAVLEPEAGVFSVPSKILAYHCAGRPILAAMPGENLAARIIAEERSGVVVPSDDEAGLLQAAELLRTDAGLRSAMGTAARNYAQTHFDIETITSRFERIFRGVMGLTDGERVPVKAELEA